MVNEKCVFDINDVKSHPYNYCIAPPDEIAKRYSSVQYKDLPGSIEECDEWDTNCIASYGSTMGQYLANGSLGIVKNILSSDCRQDYGDKYAIKTGHKCMYKGKEVDRYRYINNTRYKYSKGIETEYEGCKISDVNGGGLIAPIFGSAVPKMIPQTLFFKNIFQYEIPECKKVNLKCSVFDKEKNKMYSGKTEDIYIPANELSRINENERVSGDKNNFNKSTYCENYKDNFSNLEEAKKLFNSQNNQLNYDENINNIYYLLLSLLIIYLLFKLLNKKR